MKSLMRTLASAALVGVVVFGVMTLSLSPDAVAGKGGGKGGGGGSPCGECPCAPTVATCWLESCHLLYPSDCLWDCHYVCPLPG